MEYECSWTRNVQCSAQQTNITVGWYSIRCALYCYGTRTTHCGRSASANSRCCASCWIRSARSAPSAPPARLACRLRVRTRSAASRAVRPLCRVSIARCLFSVVRCPSGDSPCFAPVSVVSRASDRPPMLCTAVCERARVGQRRRSLEAETKQRTECTIATGGGTAACSGSVVLSRCRSRRPAQRNRIGKQCAAKLHAV